MEPVSNTKMSLLKKIRDRCTLNLMPKHRTKEPHKCIPANHNNNHDKTRH